MKELRKIKSKKGEVDMITRLPFGYENIEDFPQELLPNQYMVIEDKGMDTERLLGNFDSEIEAYKVYKKVSHKDKNIIFGNVFYTELIDVKIIQRYEEIKVIM